MMLQYNYLLTSAQKKKKKTTASKTCEEGATASKHRPAASLSSLLFLVSFSVWNMGGVCCCHCIAGALVQGTQVLEVQ